MCDKIDYNHLLNREYIDINLSQTKDFLIDKQILITGGCGSIGSEIIRQLIKLNIYKLVIYDNNECCMFNFINEITETHNSNINKKIKFILGDIRDKSRLKEVFQQNNINIVFHAAAYKHVPLMEYNPSESIKTNIIGTKNVADFSLQYKVDKFIMISTDKAVNPTNIMGACKRISELYINSLNHNKNNKCKFITTRFGNVLGSSGSVIPVFLKKIKSKKNICVTHKDVTRYFMTIPEATQLVLYSSFLGNNGEIFLFDMGEPVKIYELAKKMIKLYDNPDIGIDITGLRAGEKLYEELLCNRENVIPTTNKKIMKLNHDKSVDYELFINIFEKIIKLEYSSISELKDLFKKIVPTFKPK